jgi:hypothetical protein
MVWHRKFAGLTLAALLAVSAGLGLVASSGWFAAGAQAPAGHRQPKAGDVPQETAKKDTPRSPEDVALERALNNICRGCSQVIPVRNVPRYDITRSCPGGPSTDSCRKDEEGAKQKLQEQWAQFTPVSRSDCVQTTEIGGRPSYLQLLICLKAAQTAPTLPDGQ